MRQYNVDIDKTIIELLHKNGERTSGKLKENVEKFLNQTISFETYLTRLKAMIQPFTKQSRYAIQPVLQKKDEGRGKKVLYSLTKDAKIRCDLKLPLLKSEAKIEKAYRLLLYYMVFETSLSLENSNKKLKDENEFYTFLQRIQITKNELQYVGKLRAKDSVYVVTSWIHPQSEITFYRKDYLDNSGKNGQYEYSYILPGISISEFVLGIRSGRVYEDISFNENEVNEYFKLLKEKNLIKKLQSYPLMIPDEERYIIVDNSLKELLANCWSLASYTHTYFQYIWQAIRKPTDAERIWYEHLWGKNRSQRWFNQYNNIRREYMKKNKNQVLKETQERIDTDESEMRDKFDSINIQYAKLINDYSYLIGPLLNIVYPQFLREVK